MACMAEQVQHIKSRHATWMFKKYCVNLAVRTALLGLGVYFFICDITQLAIENVGLVNGFNFIDAAFLFVLYDFLTKFTSRAKISIGSLKQYKFFQIPTKNTVGGTIDAFLSRVSEVVKTGILRTDKIHIHPKEGIQNTVEETRSRLINAKDDVSRELRHIARDLDLMRALPFNDSDLDVNSQARHVLRMRRLKEILPVAVFWVLLTALVGIFLIYMGWMSSEVVALWMLFFFWFDMVCVVLWCPLQVIFMRNRCCATCQIFNWDAIMVATPLIFAWCWQAAILFIIGAVVLLRWEVRAFFHPERFAEETNASLSCGNCKEQLCFLRGKIGFSNKDEKLEEALHQEG